VLTRSERKKNTSVVLDAGSVSMNVRFLSPVLFLYSGCSYHLPAWNQGICSSWV